MINGADISIDTENNTPIYEQLRNSFIRRIATKHLKGGDILPSARSVAEGLGINFHTVNKAYSILQAEGFVVHDRRKGMVVSPKIQTTSAATEALSEQLNRIAAEAVCRGMNDMNFIALCMKSYRGITSEQPREID